MYICKKCGNKRTFTEENVYDTYLVIDEQTGEPQHSSDKFAYRKSVTCEECGASSYDADSIMTIEGELIYDL